ncbi:MAG: hypothetical protein IK115_08835 [Lachnospiraceae bacterium]|nr:hypothetical protein [Lachnospiraceae bacterium]
MKRTEICNSKGLVIARAAALILLGIYFGIIAFSAISGVELPDMARRFLGIIDLIALPVGVFASVRIHIMKKERMAG